MLDLFGSPSTENRVSSTARSGSVNRASKWRGASDFYPTPAGATRALCRLGVLPRFVWEPACGDGAMVRVLKAEGHEVIATDLHDRGQDFPSATVDFLQCYYVPCGVGAIVTNPPFNIADDFVAHALNLNPEIAAFFLRLKWLEGRRRYDRILRDRPPAEVHVFVERVKFFSGDHAEADQPGWSTEAFAWFVWRRGVVQAPRIGWVSERA